MPKISDYTVTNLALLVGATAIKDRLILTAVGALAPKPLMRRNMINCVVERLKPQAMLKTKYSKLLACRIAMRPYISESGARKRGPTAQASTKVERQSWVLTSSWISKSLAIAGKHGAMIEEETDATSENAETAKVPNHRLCNGQF